MKHVLKAVLLAVVVAALGAASAQAALPEFGGTLPNSFTSKSGLSKFENEGSTLAIECTSSEGKGGVASVKTGTFDELFLGCTATISKIKVGKCTGESDTVEGSILAKGSALLAYANSSLTPVEVLSLAPEVHIACPGSTIVVKGHLCGTTTLAKGITGTLKFEGSGGKNTITKYTEASGGTEKECQLLSSLNSAAFKNSNQIQTSTLTFTSELEVKD